MGASNAVADMPKDYIPKHSTFQHHYRAGFSRFLLELKSRYYNFKEPSSGSS